MKEKFAFGELFCPEHAYRGVIFRKAFTCFLKFLAGYQAARISPRGGPLGPDPRGINKNREAILEPRGAPISGTEGVACVPREALSRGIRPGPDGAGRKP